tara:strand:+ start:4829 stop:5566 length:738 start_codon:yes stop_codon:yes gene_type:complete
MEALSDTSRKISNSVHSNNFLNHVFNFDEENKAQIVNLFQYTILAIIPVILTLKAIKYLIPEEDVSKGSLEILLECIGQIFLIILAIWFSNRMIRYIPTYSKYEYTNFDAISFMLPFLIILSTMQTKFGAKLNILFDRVMALWMGEKDKEANTNNNQKNNQNVVKVTQPISNMNMPAMQPNHIDTSLLPPPGQIPQMTSSQNNTDFSEMYHQQPTGMPGGSMPGGGLGDMVVAANEGMGSPFSNW